MNDIGFRSVMATPSSPREGLSPAGGHPAPSATLVIFGAHGDLTKRLLIPSLYNLAASQLLDPGFKILGIDRVEDSSDGWRQSLAATMQDFTKDPNAEFYVEQIDQGVWGWLSERIDYARADFSKPDDIRAVGAKIHGNAIFYLAVAARFFGDVVEQLGKAGLLQEDEASFRRVVIEKPYGSDLASAKALNARVLAQADEKQIFRIDHFLGKETVQNILALRFANAIFEPIWRREHIDSVQITAAETVGVEGRGAFYEPTGALRDMVPNHLFQLLSMVAMESPNSFDAEAVRDEKARLLHAITPLELADIARGQYAAGTVQNQAVPAYRDEKSVAADSVTETYVALRLRIENWRWAGVPFYLRTGKRLRARRTEIAIHFRKPPFSLFRTAGIPTLDANVLTLAIQPHQGLHLSLSAKRPGPTMSLAPIDLHFSYEEAFKKVSNVGYETLIYDALIGDSTLYQRADMIEASWAAVDNILAHPTVPELYDAGTDGPRNAVRLLADDRRVWCGLA